MKKKVFRMILINVFDIFALKLFLPLVLHKNFKSLIQKAFRRLSFYVYCGKSAENRFMYHKAFEAFVALTFN